ncbi:c1fef3eb-e1b6-4183-ae95-45c47b09c6f1 [Sclerotinia trifoliorum]|uniref:C1fef3eb-e1b6-4183-ae95-45c47b09c6f1 n=1 Tax=Sclerotinia trifoliorum TaxID=28548 RepID=A0A8H2ZQD5_9HELO|nr:c1fef3eb-e1b6-4183-ae95-45c47b09c6f1 [Sclerotinia trifoliorum]
MYFSSTRLVALSSILGTSFARLKSVEVDTSSLDKLYTAALKEDRKLVVASGGDAGVQGQAIRDAWAARFPKISLDLTVDLSKYHDSRIDRAHWNNTDTVDIALLQTLHDFQRWKEEGRLLFYKPPTFADLYSGEKDLDGAFLPVSVNSFGTFVYDSTYVPDSEAPTSYADLLDPKWKGKIVATYPNDDDAIGFLFSIIIEKYGFEWLEGMANQDVQWVRGTGTPGFVIRDNHNGVNASASGSSPKGRVLTFTSYPPANATTVHSAVPVAPEQHMSWSQTIAAFASSKRPQTAKLFLAWITSDEYQKNSTTGSVRKSLDIGGNLYESNTTQTIQFRQFMQDRKRVEWWKLQYETTLGTAQGVGPMILYP